MTAPGATNADGSLSGSDTNMGGSNLGVSGSDPYSASGSGSQQMVADGSWLAGLAMGDSTRISCASALHSALFIASAIFIF